MERGYDTSRANRQYIGATMKPTQILLATDLSCRCDRALDRATALASEWQARLIVLHALGEPEPVTDMPSWRRTLDPRQAAEQRVRDDLRGAEGLSVEVLVRQGKPAPLILETVGQRGCDLVVTGVARDETLGRLLLGTTVDAVVRSADVPVLVAKSRPRGPYRNVVVATDFSEGSRHALQTVLAWLPEASVSLFHAYAVAYEGLLGDQMAAREQVGRRRMEEARDFLADTPGVAGSGRVIPTVCEYGDVEVLLRDLVQARAVDLVALGTAGRGRLASVLLGSVAQRLLSAIPVDVLAVRRPRD